MRLVDGETFKLFITLGEPENILSKSTNFARKSFFISMCLVKDTYFNEFVMFFGKG